MAELVDSGDGNWGDYDDAGDQPLETLADPAKGGTDYRQAWIVGFFLYYSPAQAHAVYYHIADVGVYRPWTGGLATFLDLAPPPN